MIKRLSPVDLGLKPKETLDQNGWRIPFTYHGEQIHNALALCDLSHVPKRILQGHDLDSKEIGPLPIPPKPGGVFLAQGLLIIRTTPSECRIMSLDGHSTFFTEPRLIAVTDAFVSLALIGEGCFEVLSKLSPVDLKGPNTSPLFAAMAPVEEIVCLIVCIEGEKGPPGLIVSCARGYGDFLLKVFLDAGKSFGIAPAGWKRFGRWLGEIAGSPLP